MWEFQISWRKKKEKKKKQKSEALCYGHKVANSIFILDTMNELGTLMQYSYPLQKIFLADKSIASRTGHDKVWDPFEKDCSLKETNENVESDVTVFVFFIYSSGSEPRTECTRCLYTPNRTTQTEKSTAEKKNGLDNIFKHFCSLVG